MKAMTVDCFLESAAAHETAGDKTNARLDLQRAQWLSASGRDSARYVGYVAPSDMPNLKPGDTVVIPAGTIITGCFPDSQKTTELPDGRRCRVAGRNYKVAVHRISSGYMEMYEMGRRNSSEPYMGNPEVVFVGSGGYYCHVDLNDVSLPEMAEAAA